MVDSNELESLEDVAISVEKERMQQQRFQLVAS